MPPAGGLLGSVRLLNETLLILRRLAADDAYPARLATLARVEGSSYRRAGARLLLEAAGTRLGSISGGCLEEDLIARLRALSPAAPLDVAMYDTTSENDLVWGVGTGCHGVVHLTLEYLTRRPDWLPLALDQLERRHAVELAVRWSPPLAPTRLAREADASDGGCFVQAVPPPVKLVVFGAGDDAQPVVRIAKDLGWVIHVGDPRPGFARADRFPAADRVEVIPPEGLAEFAAPDRLTAVVVMTHHYRFDRPALEHLLPLPLPYLGLLGPRRRAERLAGDLAAAGGPPAADTLSRLHAPVGLDLGGDGPEAVALSILAEIQAVFAGRDAQPLRRRAGGIHDG